MSLRTSAVWQLYCCGPGDNRLALQARAVHEKKVHEKKAQETNAVSTVLSEASGAYGDRARHSKSNLKKATGTAVYAVFASDHSRACFRPRPWP